jgi:2-hydroxy-3-oxopropionate reductase
LPSTHRSRALLAEDFAPGFRAVLMRKDLRLALGCAQDAGAVMPVAAATLQFLEAACNTGHAQEDWSVVGQVIAELAAPLDLNRA